MWLPLHFLRYLTQVNANGDNVSWSHHHLVG